MIPVTRTPGGVKKYYHEKDPIEKDNGQWFGKGADALGLSQGSQIRQVDLNYIVSGYSKEGKKLIQSGSTIKKFDLKGVWQSDVKYKEKDLVTQINQEGKEERWLCIKDNKSKDKNKPSPQSPHWELFGHRACEEIILSLPKSASLIGYHVGIEHVIDAHKRAVKMTARFIEDNLIYARVTKNEITTAYKTGNAVIALFDHSTSRMNDPQVHTHVLVMNMTHTENGYRAVWNDRIYELQKLTQNVYQSYASKYIRDLGYDIVADANGKWEIAGVKQEWIDIFSKRSKQIDQIEIEIKKYFQNESDAVIRNKAAQAFKPEKSDMPHQELQRLWQSQVDRDIISQAVERAKTKYQGIERSALSYIELACKAIHENESAFKETHVLDVAMRLSRGEYTFEDIEKSFNTSIRSGAIKQLAEVKHNHHAKKFSEPLYSTPEMIKIEQGIIRSIRQGVGRSNPIIPFENVTSRLKQHYDHYKLGQKKAVCSIFGKNKIAIIQGKAGSGKTTMLRGAYEILQNEAPECEIIAVAITGRAADEIENKSGIPSQTVDKFLSSKPSYSNQKIIIVDEVGMLGSKKFDALIERAKQDNAKLICIGDKNQLLPISAGRMYRDIQEMGLPVVVMDEAIRQETQEMVKLVRDIENYQSLKDPNGIQTVMTDLYQQGRLILNENSEIRLLEIVETFMTHEDRNNTLILTGLNNDRDVINNIIFSEMQKLGVVSQDIFEVQVKIPVSIVGPKKYFSSSYEVGNFAYIEKIGQDVHLDLDRGQEVEIIKADHVKNTITVETRAKKQIEIDCKADIDLSVYKIENRNFSSGAKIVFIKNDNKFKVKNGLCGEIENISPSGMFRVKIPVQNRTVEFHPSQYAWFDRGWAVTPYKAQGADANHILHNANTETPWQHTTEELYLAASRAKKSYTMFADKAEIYKCFEHAQKKSSTIDIHQYGYPQTLYEYAQKAWENFQYKLSHMGVDHIYKVGLDPITQQVIAQMGGLSQAGKWEANDPKKAKIFIQKYQEIAEKERIFQVHPNTLNYIDPIKEKNVSDVIWSKDIIKQNIMKSADDAWNELVSGFRFPGIEEFSRLQNDQNIRNVVYEMGGWSQLRMWKAIALEPGSEQEKRFKTIYNKMDLIPDQHYFNLDQIRKARNTWVRTIDQNNKHKVESYQKYLKDYMPVKRISNEHQRSKIINIGIGR